MSVCLPRCAGMFDFFKISYTLILQNSPRGLFVLRVSATDDDLGSNAKITYSLEGTTLAL